MLSITQDHAPPVEVKNFADGRDPRPSTIFPITRFDGKAMAHQRIADDQLPGTLSLDEVEGLLDETFAESQPTMDAMEHLVWSLGSSPQLRQIITEIIRDRKRLASIAGVSEKHPLGFYKIPLLSKTAYQLRFNIRPGKTPDRSHVRRRSVLEEQLTGMQDVHNHGFDAASRVKIGKLVTTIYEITDEPPHLYQTYQQINDADDPVEAQRSIEWLHRQDYRNSIGYREEHDSIPAQIFRADQSDSSSEAFEASESGYVRLLYNAIINMGGVYSFTHNTFHTDRPLSSIEPTVTLFLRGPKIFGPDTIARKGNDRVKTNERTETAKQRMSPQEVKLAFTTFKKLIGD